MKIGIDGRLLTETVTGIGRYTVEMIAAMLGHGADLRIYCPARPTDAALARLPKDLIRYGDYKSRVGRLHWAARHLPRWAEKERVDVFWGPTHRLPSSLSRNIPAAVTIHDLVWRHAGETMRPLNRWLDRTLMPRAIARADLVVAVSNATARDIAREWPHHGAKIKTVYPGIASLPAPQDRESLEKFSISGTYFLFVGTLEPRKNLQGLLYAYGLLPSALRSANRLVIAGGKGWGKLDVRDLVGKLGLQQDVILTGYTSDQDLATLYAHARFLAMPSLYEGFGLPVAEAMSFGVPSLISELSSLPEVAGDAALSVNPRSAESIAKGIETMLSDRTLYLQLAANAIHNAQRFSWCNAAREMLQLFAALQ